MSSMVNISSITLNEAQQSVLNRGLSFCPVSRTDWFHMELDLHRFLRSIRLKIWFSTQSQTSRCDDDKLTELSLFNTGLYVKSNFNPVIDHPGVDAFSLAIRRDLDKLKHDSENNDLRFGNISSDEIAAMGSLASDHNLTIKSADKGGGVVVMDTREYIEEIHGQLEDIQVYKRIKNTLKVTTVVLYDAKSIAAPVGHPYFSSWWPTKPVFLLDIKGGIPASTATWSFQVGGNQPVNGLDLKEGTPGSTDIKGGIPGSTDIKEGTPSSTAIKGGTPDTTDIKGGTPGSSGSWSYQFGGNQPANGLDIKGGTPGSTGTWSFQFVGNQPVNGLDVKGGTPGSTDINGGISGSTDIKGGTPGSTDLNGGTPGSTATWSFQYGGNQPMNGLGVQVVKEERKGQRQGLLQSLLHVGGNIISNTGELVKGIGETAGDLKNSIIGGENHGLIPSVIDAGEEVMKETGGIINGIGDIFGGL
ncbi:uncharacterized protein LOC120985791 [Bufo bufo]|uniref:uncharacterized protein LOC120985791 n=1 Tax=Bufo bufo TaxID=8384 RepID=UPI001ABE22D7|nr:uncharacterized protein LOC120985791 [Bufo bufo]